MNHYTNTLIEDFKTIDQNHLELHHSLEKRLSFSPNGKQLLVALKNKCLMLPVPFDVRYKAGTEEKLWVVFYSLKKYEDIHIPFDIINVITEKLLDIHEHLLI